MEKEYVIEALVGRRYAKGHQYLVKWEGYPESENTWEKRESLMKNAKKMVEEFDKKWEAEHPKKNARVPKKRVPKIPTTKVFPKTIAVKLPQRVIVINNSSSDSEDWVAEEEEEENHDAKENSTDIANPNTKIVFAGDKESEEEKTKLEISMVEKKNGTFVYTVMQNGKLSQIQKEELQKLYRQEMIEFLTGAMKFE